MIIASIVITILFALLAWAFAGYIKREQQLSDMADVAKKKERQSHEASNYNEDGTIRDLGAGRF